MRTFDTGATRDNEDDKVDYEGFMSPIVMQRFGQYMHQHRKQNDGQIRASDNWQMGIPFSAYMKSAFRHFVEWWQMHRSGGSMESLAAMEDTLCAMMFNVQGYLHELLVLRSRRS